MHEGDSKKYPGIQVKQVVPLEHVKQSFEHLSQVVGYAPFK